MANNTPTLLSESSVAILTKYVNRNYFDYRRQNRSIRFAAKGIVIPMGMDCAPLIADLILYCYKSQFMTQHSQGPSEFHLIDKFNNTYRYLDDIFS